MPLYIFKADNNSPNPKTSAPLSPFLYTNLIQPHHSNLPPHQSTFQAAVRLQSTHHVPPIATPRHHQLPRRRTPRRSREPFGDEGPGEAAAGGEVLRNTVLGKWLQRRSVGISRKKSVGISSKKIPWKRLNRNHCEDWWKS